MIRKLWHRLFPPQLPPRDVWLTFDDGPHPRNTPKVLATLRRHGIHATFFLCGKEAAAAPELVARIAAEGHSIGNHTYNHHDLTKLEADAIAAELEQTRTLLAAHQRDWRLFRAPYGSLDARSDAVVRELGYKAHKWNVDPSDWRHSYIPRRWVSIALEQMRPKREAVVVMHDRLAITARHLDFFIRRVKAAGPVQFRQL